MTSPFLVAQFPDAEVGILSYGTVSVQQEALIAALRTGDVPGRVVVALPAELAAPSTDWGTAQKLDLGPSFA
jgi:hypothetical protein